MPFDFLKEDRSAGIEWKKFLLPQGDIIKMLICKDLKESEYSQQMTWFKCKQMSEEQFWSETLSYWGSQSINAATIAHLDKMLDDMSPN